MRRRWPAVAAAAGVLLAVAAVAVSLAFVLGKIGLLSESNRDLSCSTARLIAHVPAIQFEGEPRSNFVGWLRARRDVLVDVQEGGQCPESTVKLLEHRVRLDNEALRQLR